MEQNALRVLQTHAILVVGVVKGIRSEVAYEVVWLREVGLYESEIEALGSLVGRI